MVAANFLFASSTLLIFSETIATL